MPESRGGSPFAGATAGFSHPKPFPPHFFPFKTRMSFSRRGAFTLIELLVSLVLVAVLAAFLFVNLRSSKRSSDMARSTVNLMQMGTALLAHAADNGGKLVEGAHYPSYQGVKYRFWFDVLDIYIGNAQGTAQSYFPQKNPHPERPPWQQCPAKVFPEPLAFQGWAVGIGYGWNYGNFGNTPPAASAAPANGWGTTLQQVREPGKTIIIGTSTDLIAEPDVLRHIIIYSGLGFAPQSVARRFNGKGLYLFLDRHVEALTPEEATADNGRLFKQK